MPGEHWLQTDHKVLQFLKNPLNLFYKDPSLKQWTALVFALQSSF